MNIQEYIASGILEAYVLGIASEEERREVERIAALHRELKAELDTIAVAMEKRAFENAVEPHPAVKPLLMATLDYMKRLENGEAPSFPPILNENSKPEDYRQWISRPDMQLPAEPVDLYAKIIGYTPEATSAIVWIRSMAPQEVHDNEFEKFLILEGTCDIIVGSAVHQLVPGDYFQIPLHARHEVKVTSSIPCKIILQRVAA
jgi:mannose-6-phosphate isomerase-like protein (cupin superfamily)